VYTSAGCTIPRGEGWGRTLDFDILAGLNAARVWPDTVSTSFSIDEVGFGGAGAYCLGAVVLTCNCQLGITRDIAAHGADWAGCSP
jgi:hypothetical protein